MPDRRLIMRPYADADMPQLQQTFAGWIAEAGRCGYDHIGELPHRIYENLRGRRPVGELVHVWESDGQTVGLAINLRFGSAFDVFTAPSLRGTAEERQMIKLAAGTTARHMTGATADPYVLTDVFSCDTTRIEQLARLGFERFRTWDFANERDLRRPVPEPRVPDGFVVRGARMGDADQIASARNHSFDDSWTSGQYRSEFMEKPGYDPGREIVVEAPDGRVAAFTVYWVDERNRIGHFEPVGAHREFQRRGLARAAMLYAMRRMRELGIETVTVNHNAENLPALRLYESIGFTRHHETYGYRRPLSAMAGDLAMPMSTSHGQAARPTPANC